MHLPLQELSTDAEVKTDDVVSSKLHSPFLGSVYAAEIGFNVTALLLNLLLHCALGSYSVFHAHMAVVCRHICKAFMVSSAYGIFRSSIAMADWFASKHSQLSIKDEDIESCPFKAAIPTFACILLSILPFILVIERYYATKLSHCYEHSDIQGVVKCICNCLWIPFPFLLLAHVLSLSYQDIHFVPCQISEMQKSPLQRNIWHLIIAFFNSIICVIFMYLSQYNKEQEVDYVKYHYSTISIRYQMRENWQTCQLLFKIHLYITFFFLAPMAIDLLSTTNDQELEILWAREIWYLCIPMLNVFYPVYFIRGHEKLNCRISAKIQLWGGQSARAFREISNVA